MNDPKKNPNKKKSEIAKEPTTDYEKATDFSIDNEEEMHPILVQLLEKAIKESEQGLGRPHEEVWAEMKAKYNFK
jgi:hypothetical protein